MSYITGPGSHDSWMVWTNEANFNTEMNPANFQYVNWKEGLGRSESSVSPPGNVATIGPRKILDAGLTARQGVPVYVTLHSGARRNTVPTGYVFGRLHQSKSSGSSSEQNGTHVGSDGTFLMDGKILRAPDAKKVRTGSGFGQFRYKYSCPKGFKLQTVHGNPMCVKQ